HCLSSSSVLCHPPQSDLPCRLAASSSTRFRPSSRSFPYTTLFRSRVDEGRYTLEGVLHQACRVARLDVAEDQRCTYRYGYCVDYAGHVLAQWDHTHVGSGLVSDFCTLVDDTAHQGHQDTLCLVALYQLHPFFCGGGCAQDNGYARDVAGYQRHAQ